MQQYISTSQQYANAVYRAPTMMFWRLRKFIFGVFIFASWGLLDPKYQLKIESFFIGYLRYQFNVNLNWNINQIRIAYMGSLQYKIFFPAPRSSYNQQSIKMQAPDVEYYNCPYIWQGKQYTFPLIFLPYFVSSGKIAPVSILFFHGNAEDLGLLMEFLHEFRTYLKANIFALEYPGYGTSMQRDKNPDVIKCNSVALYRIVHNIGFPHENIVIFGRSIGSGPACHVAASIPQAQHLVLMSPLSSVRTVTRDHCCLVSCCVNNFFENSTCAKITRARPLVIHGQQDQVIPFHNGVQIVQAYNSTHSIPCQFHPVRTMSHNNFNLSEDILQPTLDFLPKPTSPTVSFSRIQQLLLANCTPLQCYY